MLTWRQRGALRVAACSKAARQAGVVCDTPLAEADSLLRRAGKRPWVLPHQPQTDWETLCELAEHCEPLSPRVGCECMTPFRWLDSNPHRDCLWLDASNLAAIYGGERELAAHACRWLMQWGYYARGGLADTVGAAWAAARQLAHAQRPWVRIAPGRQFAALAQLPVSCLRLPERLTQDLRRLGVLRVRQAAQLPRRLVPARLGETLLWRLDQARGDAAETIVPLRVEPVLLAARELEPPALDGQAAMCVLRELLGELLRRLPSRNHGIHRLTCRFSQRTRTAGRLERRVDASFRRPRPPRTAHGIAVRAWLDARSGRGSGHGDRVASHRRAARLSAATSFRERERSRRLQRQPASEHRQIDGSV